MKGNCLLCICHRISGYTLLLLSFDWAVGTKLRTNHKWNCINCCWHSMWCSASTHSVCAVLTNWPFVYKFIFYLFACLFSTVFVAYRATNEMVTFFVGHQFVSLSLSRWTCSLLIIPWGTENLYGFFCRTMDELTGQTSLVLINMSICSFLFLSNFTSIAGMSSYWYC